MSPITACVTEKNKNRVLTSMFSLSDFPLSVSQEELKAAQKADRSLQSLFEQVMTDAQIKNSGRWLFP